MPHSTRKRKQIEKHKTALNKRVKNINEIMLKKNPTSHKITLPFVSLGDLRHQGRTSLHPALICKESVSNFTCYKADSTTPLEIHGSDRGLLAYRLPGMESKYLETLHSTINNLPLLQKNTEQNSINHEPSSETQLAVWCPYSTTPVLSSEFEQHEIAHRHFIEANEKVWNRMTFSLGHVAPKVFKDVQRFPLPSGMERLCKTWCACVVNKGGVDEERTEQHRNVHEGQAGYSCLCSTGNYSGGGLILYELEAIIEMNAGDIVIFPDSLITYANEEVVGERNSVMCSTQENTLEYWATQFNTELPMNSSGKSEERVKSAEISVKSEEISVKSEEISVKSEEI
jgi:hypothetical protein